MKKFFIFSIAMTGFAIAASAQASATQPSTPSGTEVKPAVEVKANEGGAQAQQPANAEVKKECAGHGTGGCSKAGTAKSCCKASKGAASATADSGDKNTAAADKKKSESCKSGEHKDCCKKKAEAKSGS
ncbi:MAG: hypothetical protein KG003_06330 [Bacteroidetes bacterium]|nr:hypothetical protein [Bacteroidota bacterium]